MLTSNLQISKYYENVKDTDSMAELTFLDGKVRKQSLPQFTKSPPAGTEGTKRLFLPQGELANFYDADEGIRYAALIELQVGGIRGNHWHRVKEEQVYVAAGEVLFVAQLLERGPREEIRLEAGDLVKISIEVAHAFRPLRAGYAIEFSRTRFDPTDIQRFALL